MSSPELNHSLIRLLITLYRTGSLRAAAEALRISTPSASYVLSHARDLFGDPLFRRTNTGMTPTTRMAELMPELEALAAGMNRVLAGDVKIFSPALSQMRFRIACFDNFIPLMLGPAMQHIRKAAPNLKMELIPQTEGVIEDMRRGHLDFCLRANATLPGDFHSLVAARSNFAVLAAREHPLVRRAMSGEQITRADLAPFAQLQIRVPLQTKGVTRPLSFEKDEDSVKVFLSTQSFLGPPLLLPGTDLLLVLPRPTAAFWVNFAPSLAMFDVAEFSETPFTARFFWHERVDASPQHQWLRGIFAQAADNQ